MVTNDLLLGWNEWVIRQAFPRMTQSWMTLIGESIHEWLNIVIQGNVITTERDEELQ